MKTRGLVDLYLPCRVAYHAKIVLGGILITTFFNIIWRGAPFVDGFWYVAVLTIIQLEIFMAIATGMFPQVKPGRKYKRKIVVRLVLFYLLVLLIAIAFLLIIISIGAMVNDGNFADILQYFISHELGIFLVSLSIGFGVGSVAFFYFEWEKSLKREQKLNEEKLVFKYETLKNQVNPHFLFNSLNTLASLVSTDAKLSEQFIARFASIYRYILEKQDREVVSLLEEIAFINDYFFLQKIRDNGKIDLRIEISNPENYQVLPISLQMLVENALKHNAATHDTPLTIRIGLEDDEAVVVENNLQRKMRMEPSSGIGLKNLKERIRLVMKKELEIIETDEKFIVRLPVMKTMK